MSDITAASANLGRVEKWLQFSKKHWKKAVIATPFVSFFAYFMHGRYEEDRLVRLACQRAQVFGRQVSIFHQNQPKKLVKTEIRSANEIWFKIDKISKHFN